MKICVNIVILLFIMFLATPTLVYILADDDTEVSVVCSLEEEIQKDIKEVKAGPQMAFEFIAFIPVVKKAAIKSKNLQRHTNVSGDIFLHPPENV